MKDLNDIQALWKSASPDDLPPASEIRKNIKRFRSIKLQNKILSVTVAILVIIPSIFILFMAKNFYLTTQLAIVFNVFSCAILAFTNLRSMGRFREMRDFNNLEFLQFLGQTRRNQVYYHKRTQVACLILVSASTILFPYQFIINNFVIAIITYAIVFIWLLILWLYIRPKTFNKHSKRLTTELKYYERIIAQTH